MKTQVAVKATPGPAPAEEGQVLHTLARGWDRFWFTPADPTTLGLIRILAGILVVYVHIAYTVALMDYLGPHAWADQTVGAYMRSQAPVIVPRTSWPTQKQMGLPDFEIYRRGKPIWSLFFDVQATGWVVTLHLAFLVAMILFTAGVCTRVTSVLTWMGAMSHLQRAPTTLFGMDTMMMILLFYLMIGPSGAALSFDHWWQRRQERRRRQAEGLPPADERPAPLIGAGFALRLIQVNFCIIYLASGTSKLLGNTWWAGSAPSRVFLNYSFAPFNVPAYTSLMRWLAQYRVLWEPAMAIGVVYTLILELGFPFLVWRPRLRWLMVSGAVILHTNIGLFMGLVTFSLFMLVMVLAFVPSEVVRQLIDSLSKTVQRWRHGDSPPPQAKRRPESLVLTRS